MSKLYQARLRRTGSRSFHDEILCKHTVLLSLYPCTSYKPAHDGLDRTVSDDIAPSTDVDATRVIRDRVTAVKLRHNRFAVGYPIGCDEMCARVVNNVLPWREAVGLD